MWKKCCFSGDGEYVCAGSAKQHASTSGRRVSETLSRSHGTKGDAPGRGWLHPWGRLWRASAAASSPCGRSSRWRTVSFAPDKELDENVDYERESESTRRMRTGVLMEKRTRSTDIEVDVDVTSKIPVAAYCSSDEEDEKTRTRCSSDCSRGGGARGWLHLIKMRVLISETLMRRRMRVQEEENKDHRYPVR